MKTRLEKSIEYISGYCEKHSKCESCPLFDEEDGCVLRKVPTEWVLEKKGGRQ